MIFLAIYIIGYFASLWAMHTFKKQLDIDDYDTDPQNKWPDDYESNSEAYVSISFAWPFFWLMMILKLTWKLTWNGLMFISKKLEK
jgi:hypothetical protein